jgi:hypothetical protein
MSDYKPEVSDRVEYAIASGRLPKEGDWSGSENEVLAVARNYRQHQALAWLKYMDLLFMDRGHLVPSDLATWTRWIDQGGAHSWDAEDEAKIAQARKAEEGIERAIASAILAYVGEGNPRDLDIAKALAILYGLDDEKAPIMDLSVPTSKRVVVKVDPVIGM